MSVLWPRSVAVVCAALAACASSRPAVRAEGAENDRSSSRTVERGGPAGLPAAAPRRQISPRAQRLFDEAVAEAQAQKRKGGAPDWDALERRWHAVLDAESIPEGWFNLGVTFEARGRLGDARSAYKDALKADKDFAPAAVNLALLDEPKDPREAAQMWSELMRRFPDDAVPRARLASFYAAAGQNDESWQLAREALVRDPRSLGAFKVMMKIALQRGKPDLAQLLALKAKKIDASDPEIEAFLGEVFLHQKDGPAAVAAWKKALALRPDYLPARYALLSDALGKQRWEGVVEHARAILVSRPGEGRVLLALGIAYRYLGQPDKALEAYAQAERAGGAPDVYLARGIVLMKSKEQCEPALDELKRYLASAGPAASEGPAGRLVRECTEIIAANKAAQEAAREMKAEAAREAQKAEAEKAAKKAAEEKKAAPEAKKAAPVASQESAKQAVSAGAPADTASRPAPTR